MYCCGRWRANLAGTLDVAEDHTTMNIVLLDTLQLHTYILAWHGDVHLSLIHNDANNFSLPFG
jgi:hypothetical protein